ncbi:MAG: Stp1/IreP family PP2C-type Ser/Thr phosphatase [Deltaproteobacteria bacterium]|nr:Stp1/IreP family PP2C-type Ser/Thr phosphatase [Deltaproteobacteria bacterium]
MRIQSFGISDQGLFRDHNEDYFSVDEKTGLFLVADGMGGLSKGDVASRIAIETIEDFVKHSRLEDITWPIKPHDDYSLEENRFLAAISLANWNIYNEFRKDVHNRHMGTTLVGLLVDNEKLVIANVGDSRIYRIGKDVIEQLTEDHSLVMDEVRKGAMTLDEARNHPQKHVINRALGISESTQVDISTLDIMETDLYLLCSDGLSDMLTDDDMLSLIQANEDRGIEDQAEALLEAANHQGGRDNITVVLVRFLQ